MCADERQNCTNDCITMCEMPRYIGTKRIWAIPMDYATFQKKEKGNQEDMENAPGYLVVYPDGYRSWSPKHVFEQAYCFSNIDPNSKGKTFGEALEWVKSGKGMRLPSWKEDVIVRCFFPTKEESGTTEDGKSAYYNHPTFITAPYLYVESRFGRVPWKETMIELFAENWEIVE